MAITERFADRLAPIRDEVMRAIAAHGLEELDDGGAKGILRVELEENVRRIVQVYWTPFQADVPGESIGLHLEVAEPRVFWAECYLSPQFRNWVFCFAERPDGEIQLSFYEHYASPSDAIKGFFDLSAWYVLTASETTWPDVRYQVSERLGWGDVTGDIAGRSTNSAVQEALKKSTILWLRWSDDGQQRSMPVWFINDKGRLYVLSGERNQTIPNVERLRRCDVIFRQKGKNVRIAEIPATLRILDHGPEWDEVAEKIAEKRLNIPGLPEETARRWRDECHIVELTLLG